MHVCGWWGWGYTGASPPRYSTAQFSSSLFKRSEKHQATNTDIDLTRIDIKVQFLFYHFTGPAPAIPRLGIGPYQWGTECLSGDSQAGDATSFPMSIGMVGNQAMFMCNSCIEPCNRIRNQKIQHNLIVGIWKPQLWNPASRFDLESGIQRVQNLESTF